MSQDWNSRYPLVELQGNNGSRDGDSPAAMRYTEIKLTAIGEHNMEDVNKNTVDFQPNYDNTELEPIDTPTMLPMLFANGCDGIAVGMATSIPPHNLTELMDASLKYIENVKQNKETTLDDLMEHIKGPDFPDGGIIVSKKDLKKAYETGKGKVTLRGKCEIVESGKQKKIIIKELPYQVNKERLCKKIRDLGTESKVEGIREVIDSSSEEKGINIEITLRKDTNPTFVLNQLYKQTELQKNVSFIVKALYDNKPITVSLLDYITKYLNHCLDVYTRKTQFELEKDYKKAKNIEAIAAALNNIETVIEILKTSDDPVEDIKTTLELESKEQAEYIVDSKLRTISKKSEEKLQEEYDELVVKIERYQSILENEDVALDELSKELLMLKNKFGDERRTTFDLTAGGDITEEDLIKEEPLVVSLTSDGLIKAVEEKEYATQKRGGKGVKGSITKDDEVVTNLFSISSKDDLLFMTNTGRCHKLKGYKIPKVAKSAKGKHINNFIDLNENEYVVSIMSLKVKEEIDNSIIFVTALGKVKRLAVKDLSSRFPATKVLTIKEGDELATCLKAKEGDDILICTAKGMSTRFTISSTSKKPINAQGRTAAGVSGIKVGEDDYVIGATLINNDDNILTLTSKGLAKQTSGSAWESKNRGIKGIICHKITEKTGEIVSILSVSKDDEIFVGTDQGKIIRLSVESIANSGRASIGTKVISLSANDYANAASLAPNNINDNEEEVAQE